MSNYKVFILFLTVPLFLTNRKKENTITKTDIEDKWGGKVSWIKTSKSKGKRIENIGQDVYRWDYFFEYRVDVNFINNKGTVIRTDITTKWEKDSVVFSKPDDKYLIEEKITKIDCNGKGYSELDVKFDDDRKNYWISFYTPDCSEHMSFQKISNIYPAVNNSSTMNHQGIQINLPANFTGQPVGNNTNVLSGKWEEITPSPNDPGGGEIITRATWDLKKTARTNL